MPWPFTKRHLRYRSIRAWISGEGIPTPFTAIKDPKRVDQVMTQLGELRKHLFDLHLRSLSEQQRKLLNEGKHPSQDHALGSAALPIARALEDKLRHLPFVKRVGVGAYHCNRNVLDVFVSGIELSDSRLVEVPDFYEGFEVLAMNETKKS
ncbi:MAG TPA: hypothetical protein VK846_18395 [Candidatus Limnocylindria bacterium]|nr:hypothetical protein [Candidatus Limnocylindria bacterium]